MSSSLFVKKRETRKPSGAHLYCRALASECKAGAHGQQAAEELDGHYGLGGRFDLTLENGFHALDAAAFCYGREPYDHKACSRSTHESERDRCKPADPGPRVCLGDEHFTKALGTNE